MKECNSIPLRHSDVVVDIGAYVGTYAIRCARFPVKSVTAYEPTPRTFGILARTELPNLEIKQEAVVADDRESVDLYISKGIGVTNSIVKAARKAGAVEVPAVKYVDAVAGATVVKIDVEGAEYTYPIIQPGIRALIIDFHPMAGRDWIARAEQMVGEITAAGFETVVKPDWSNGWTQAGSWMRDASDDGSCCDVLMSGKMCCGCGKQTDGQGKTLCARCFDEWKPQHREGFDKCPS
jgi:FkbM family methyltransferase